jgi:deoxyribodipyrimidine photo-lyase
MKTPLSIVWFKKDLRIHDHRPLARAVTQGSCLPLYIVEPELWSQKDHSARQWNFARECLMSLHDDLARCGQPLCILKGDALSIFQSLHERYGIASLWSHQETGNQWTYDRDRRIKQWMKSNSIQWHEEQTGGVIRRLTSRDHWAQRWDRVMAEPITPSSHRLETVEGSWSFELPSAEELFSSPDPCENRQKGGRAEALKLLDTFLYDRGQDYRFHMSSPLTARDACSRLSPHITWGTISLREITHAVRGRLSEIETSRGLNLKISTQPMTGFVTRSRTSLTLMHGVKGARAFPLSMPVCARLTKMGGSISGCARCSCPLRAISYGFHGARRVCILRENLSITSRAFIGRRCKCSRARPA